MSRTEKATETRMKAKDLRIAERLKARGWFVYGPCELLSVEIESPRWYCEPAWPGGPAGLRVMEPQKITIMVRPEVPDAWR